MMLGLLAAFAAGAVEVAPLPATGKWEVSQGTGQCSLSRAFVSGETKVLFGLLSFPFGRTTELVFVVPHTESQSPATGMAKLSFDPPMDIPEVRYYRSAATDGTQRIGFFVPVADAAFLATAKSLSVPGLGLAVPPIALGAPKAALAALSDCTDRIATGLGFDPVVARRAVIPPEYIGSPAEWILDSDYPADAVRTKAQGEVRIVWRVGDDGRVHDCKTLVSSGTASLDRAACTALTLRGRYRPARDDAGTAVDSYMTGPIRWRLPNR